MFQRDVPALDGIAPDIALRPGDSLYVVGATGAGKSSLLLNWAKTHADAEFVTGNRDVTFASPATTMSPAKMVQSEEWARNEARAANARYRKGRANNAEYLNRLLAALKARCEFSNAEYVRLDQAGRVDEKHREYDRSPMLRVNKALAASTLPLSVGWTERSELVVTKPGADQSYGFDEMSDGERAVLILTMTTILAKKNALFLIDEPERHLHRAISNPLLEYLKLDREDLAWVVATHDLTLARNDPTASVLVLYDFVPNKWRAELVSCPSELSSQVKEAI